MLALSKDWGLAMPDTISEEEIIRLLADRLAVYLDKGPEAFFQLMYRLDISERKLNAILHGQDPAPAIARLIYERQTEKARSRAFYKKDDKGADDPELSW